MKITLSKTEVERVITDKHGKGAVTISYDGGAELVIEDKQPMGFRDDSPVAQEGDEDA